MDIISLILAAVGIGVTAYQGEQARKSSDSQAKQALVANAVQAGQTGTFVKNAAAALAVCGMVYAAVTIIIKD